MNNLQIFKNDEFGTIRTVSIDGEPMFCLSDICKALELTQPSKVKERLNEKGVNSIPTLTNGGTQNLLYVNESNLYKTIFQSRKESAERFTDWVTSEVLPSIRKTGVYQVPQTTAGQIQLLAQGHMELLNKIETVEKNLQTFKEEMPLLALDCQRITIAKNQKVLDLLGGKTSSAYRNASLRGKVYRDMERQLKREFDVSSYKAIQRNKTDKAIEIIKAYTLPYFLQESVNDANAQINLSNLQVS